MVSLALDRAPPASLPMRFLRLAPAWGLLAGLLLLQQGAGIFASRWALGTVALVHMFTLGVFGNAMLGSLLQFLPVVAGLQPRIGRRLGAVLPGLYNLGIAGLVCGLLHWPVMLAPAGLLLAGTVATYSIFTLAGLRFDGDQTWLRAGLALALVALLAAAGLGLVLTLALSGLVAIPLGTITDMHASIGLLGAALLLAGSVGSVVLPMFQGTATPSGPALAGWIVLLVASLATGVALRLAERVDAVAPVLALPVLAFSAAVLLLQWRAPHRRNPSLVGFWRLGALALLAAMASAIIAVRWPESRGAMLAGVLAIAVGLPALIMGMLLEISTFLAWLDLQGVRVRGQRVPSVDTLMPESRKSRLLALHAIAAIALTLATCWPGVFTARIAAVAMIAGYGLMTVELMLLSRRAQRCARRVLSSGTVLSCG